MCRYVIIVQSGYFISKILTGTYHIWGTAVAQWLRCCATNRKVTGSIQAGASGFFIEIKSFRSHYSTGVDSASNRNEYRKEIKVNQSRYRPGQAQRVAGS